MTQDDLARRIVQQLDQNLNELPPDIVARLTDARKQALRAGTEPASWRSRLAAMVNGHRMVLTVTLPALFLVIAAGAVLFLQSTVSQDPFDVETALMHDELPIHAYTDPGFDAWLRNTSLEEQR
ncbi:MAG: DUF3619 family protein [Burkholderiales bacterium]|jgi:hypothetical protein